MTVAVLLDLDGTLVDAKYQSASQDDVEHFLGVLDAHDLIDAWTTSDDVEKTKPHPDIVRAAHAGRVARTARRDCDH